MKDFNRLEEFMQCLHLLHTEFVMLHLVCSHRFKTLGHLTLRETKSPQGKLKLNHLNSNHISRIFR